MPIVLKEVLDAEVDIVNNEKTLTAEKHGRVQFENVNFRYSTQTDGDDIPEWYQLYCRARADYRNSRRNGLRQIKSGFPYSEAL